MARTIIWTKKARKELIEILQYWLDRNKSNTFSLRLNSLIKEQLNLVLDFPKSGRKTDIDNVYVKVIHSYLLYYELINENLYVLTIRHSRRNPKTLKLK